MGEAGFLGNFPGTTKYPKARFRTIQPGTMNIVPYVGKRYQNIPQTIMTDLLTANLGYVKDATTNTSAVLPRNNSDTPDL
jgi:hypothetical protein